MKGKPAMSLIRISLIALLTFSAATLTSVAQAQFPTRPVRIIIGVPPGGLSDNLARALAGEVSRIWGQPVLVENRVGASDIVAADAVAKAPPDGHTLYQTNGTLLMVNQLLRKKLPFDVERDFAPVVGLVRTSDVLVVRNGLNVKTVSDLIALAREKPGALNYGSLGIGSAPHLDVEKLSVAANVRFTHIPYKGGADAARGLMSGEIDFSFNGLTSVLGQIRQGQVRAIAWGAPQRSAAIPDVPTLAESGYAFDTGSWLGWMVPASTPRPIIERISSDALQVLASPAFRDKHVLAFGLEPLNLGREPFTALMKETRASFADLFSRIKITLE